MGLQGCTALVTGANRGIGAAFVNALLDRGIERVFAGVRRLDSVDADSDGHGDRLVPVQLDVTDRAQVDAAVRACGDLDLLVSNAGMGLVRGVLDPQDEQAFRAVFETNFFGPLHLVRGLASSLRERRGGIIFVQSTGAVALSRSSPVYSASKAACLMMSLGLREQLRPDGVRVTNVFPGFVATDMTAAMTVPKVSSRQVAERALDGWLAGTPSVFPDRFAEMVEQALEHRTRELLDDPHAVMTAVVTAFLSDPLAGT